MFLLWIFLHTQTRTLHKQLKPAWQQYRRVTNPSYSQTTISHSPLSGVNCPLLSRGMFQTYHGLYCIYLISSSNLSKEFLQQMPHPHGGGWGGRIQAARSNYRPKLKINSFVLEILGTNPILWSIYKRFATLFVQLSLFYSSLSSKLLPFWVRYFYTWTLKPLIDLMQFIFLCFKKEYK